MNFEEQLVEEVRNHPALYNSASPDYKNYILKDTIWKKISERLGYPDEICRKRWRNLRDTFRRAKRSVAEGSVLVEKHKQWKHFYLLAFLDDIPNCRQSVSHLDSIAEVVTSSPTNNAPLEFVPLPEPTLHVDSRASISPASSHESIPQAGSHVYTPQASSHMSTSQASSRASTPQDLPRAKRRKYVPSVQDKFNRLLDMASQKITEELSTVEAQKTSTRLLFDFLAKRIESANLSQRQINQMENALFRIVSEKLDEFSDIDFGVDSL